MTWLLLCWDLLTVEVPHCLWSTRFNVTTKHHHFSGFQLAQGSSPSAPTEADLPEATPEGKPTANAGYSFLRSPERGVAQGLKSVVKAITSNSRDDLNSRDRVTVPHPHGLQKMRPFVSLRGLHPSRLSRYNVAHVPHTSGLLAAVASVSGLMLRRHVRMWASEDMGYARDLMR